MMSTKQSLKSGTLVLGATLAAAFLAACSGGKTADEPASGHRATKDTASQSAIFHDNMRILWEDHIAWTRLAIISIATNLSDAPSTTERLLQNQVDIGNAIKPYYGSAAGDQLTALLKDHIVIAANLVTAARAGDSAAVDQAKASWYVNADDIGAFLTTANPDAWKADEMKSMMREHLDLTFQEAVHYLTGDYKASVADYDKIHRQILSMSDMLSGGIVTQFSDRFAALSGSH